MWPRQLWKEDAETCMDWYPHWVKKGLPQGLNCWNQPAIYMESLYWSVQLVQNRSWSPALHGVSFSHHATSGSKSLKVAIKCSCILVIMKQSARMAILFTQRGYQSCQGWLAILDFISPCNSLHCPSIVLKLLRVATSCIILVIMMNSGGLTVWSQWLLELFVATLIDYQSILWCYNYCLMLSVPDVRFFQARWGRLIL